MIINQRKKEREREKEELEKRKKERNSIGSGFLDNTEQYTYVGVLWTGDFKEYEIIHFLIYSFLIFSINMAPEVSNWDTGTSEQASFSRNLRPHRFLAFTNSLPAPNQSEIYFWEIDPLLLISFPNCSRFLLMSMVLSQLSSAMLTWYLNILTIFYLSACAKEVWLYWYFTWKTSITCFKEKVKINLRKQENTLIF